MKNLSYYINKFRAYRKNARMYIIFSGGALTRGLVNTIDWERYFALNGNEIGRVNELKGMHSWRGSGRRKSVFYMGKRSTN